MLQLFKMFLRKSPLLTQNQSIEGYLKTASLQQQSCQDLSVWGELGCGCLFQALVCWPSVGHEINHQHRRNLLWVKLLCYRKWPENEIWGWNFHWKINSSNLKADFLHCELCVASGLKYYRRVGNCCRQWEMTSSFIHSFIHLLIYACTKHLLYATPCPGPLKMELNDNRPLPSNRSSPVENKSSKQKMTTDGEKMRS